MSSVHELPTTPSKDAPKSSIKSSGVSSRQMGGTSLSPQPPNRSPSPFQMTRTSDTIDSSSVKAGTTAKDLYDASPASKFRPLTSEFTFRADGSDVNGSAKPVSGATDHKLQVDEQDILIDEFGSLELVKEAGEPAQPATTDQEKELNDGLHSALPHSLSVSVQPFQYSADAEIRPQEPFYDVGFQSSLKKAQKLASKVRDCLGDCEAALQQESSLHKLYKEAERLSRFKCPRSTKIGVVGNSGQGKFHFTLDAAEEIGRWLH